MKRFITHLSSLKQESYRYIINEITEQKDLAIVSALLHDVGHGPFSHALERTTDEQHELWTIRIIQGNTEVRQVLESYRTGFSKEVAEVIQRTHPSNIIVKLLSSQLDTDRIDYLLRDSLMTGAKYGSFDLEWIINTLRIGTVNGYPEVGLDFDKGLSIAESFVMARYYMYKHVYFHKTTRCAELIIDKLFERVMELKKSNVSVPIPMSLEKLLEKSEADKLPYFLELTDHTIWYYIQLWSNHEDPILADLARRLINRNFYKSIEQPIDNFDLLNILDDIDIRSFGTIPHKESFKYLFLRDNASSSSYKDSYIIQRKVDDEYELKQIILEKM